MNLKIAILNEKGSSPLLNQQMVKALQAVEEVFDHNFVYREVELSNIGNLPQRLIDLCTEADIILSNAKASIPQTIKGNTSGRLQDYLNMHSRAYTVRSLATHSVKGMDFLLFQELEGGVPKIEENWESSNTRATDFYECTEAQITRIAHSAFKASKKRKRQLTLVHHDDHMLSSKLWCEIVRRVAESYPEVKLNLEHVHTTTKKLMERASSYDVVLSDSLFGSILANQSASLAGYSDAAPNVLFGEDTVLVHVTSSESNHFSENPIGAVLSIALMFQRVGLNEEAAIVQSAVEKSIAEGIVTPDLKPSSSFGTQEVGDCIAEHILDWEERFIPNDENIDLGQSTII